MCARGEERVRVWRAPRAPVAPVGESRRGKKNKIKKKKRGLKPAAEEVGSDGVGSEPGLGDEAPVCPKLPGTAGELIRDLPKLGARHPRQARSPRRPGARSAGASTPYTRQGVCAARAWALGAGCGRQSGPSTAGAPRGQQEEDGEEGWAAAAAAGGGKAALAMTAAC